MRRAKGPKRRAETYALVHQLKDWGGLKIGQPREIRGIVAAAYMAGYRSAARARRKVKRP